MTREPKRANTWPSSAPIAPPPSTTSDDGTSVVDSASRLVQYAMSANPGIGGTAGRVPVATTMALPASNSRSSVATTPGATIRPLPRTK